MQPTVRYFPLCKNCKSPQGAVPSNQPAFFRIEFSRPSNPDYVYLVLTKDGETPIRYEMERKDVSVEGFAEYTCNLTVTSSGLYFYHFLIQTPHEDFFVGCDNTLNAMMGKGSEWQLTVFQKSLPAPSWQKGGIFYQILPDRFFTGGERLMTKQHAVYRNDWNGIPEYRPNAEGKILNNDFFGGNLRGIIKKLGYLKSLGVTCVYLNPIFEARSNHKYDTGSYRRIDSDFGTAADLAELIKKAAKKGIKIMLDGVFSHTGDDSVYFNKNGTYDSVGAFQSQDSPYAEWYSFNDFPNGYASWWGIDTLPNTVEENKAFSEFINGEDGVIRTWTQLGLGGWRLDVVDELPDSFLYRAAAAAKARDSEVMILGEVWEDASNKISYGNRRKYLGGEQLDSVTNYPFKEDILYFIKTGDAKRLAETVHVLINNYPKDVLDNLMNLLGTHDTVRILTALGDSGNADTREKRAKAKLKNRDAAFDKLKLATVLQYTLPGNPCVYYGDEAGLEGFEDPFNRRCYPWENQDKKILSRYRRLGKIRTQNKHVYGTGRFKLITAENGVFAFKRIGQDETMLTVVNNGADVYELKLSTPHTDLLTNKPFNNKVPPTTAVILKETAIYNSILIKK
ncbi:MAG: glycoside hydrolase family 13 protein [Firmicutes bacterium]|nr:glycoside hydrolase family 13 protein [Bacillota bacterium]